MVSRTIINDDLLWYGHWRSKPSTIHSQWPSGKVAWRWCRTEDWEIWLHPMLVRIQSRYHADEGCGSSTLDCYCDGVYDRAQEAPLAWKKTKLRKDIIECLNELLSWWLSNRRQIRDKGTWWNKKECDMGGNRTLSREWMRSRKNWVFCFCGMKLKIWTFSGGAGLSNGELTL